MVNRVIDSTGHKAGDSVLQELTALVSKNIRQSDAFGRWGGEEFLIVLPETNLKNSVILAEKLRKRVEQYNFVEVGKVICSFGVNTMKENDTLDQMIKKVDDMLYIAKENGRNKVVSNVEKLQYS